MLRGTHVLVRNITRSTHDEQDRLLPGACSAEVAKKTRADDADGLDTAVRDVIHGLRAAAGETSRHDLGGVYVRICALSSVLRDPINRLLHGLRVGLASAVGCALGDGKEAVTGNLLQKRLVGFALVAAGSVAPDEHWHLGGASALGWVVDGVVAKRVLGLVCAWAKLSATAGSLLVVSIQLVSTVLERGLTFCRASMSTGDAMTLSKQSAAKARTAAYFILLVM